MNLNFKNFLLFTFLFLLIGGLGQSRLWADPFENVTSDQRLYQRVRQLGNYGLLDDQDKKVLDDGLVVTRMELAFYVEKAKARIEAPQFVPVAKPVAAVPTSTPVLTVPAAEAPSLPPPVMAVPVPPAATPTVEAPPMALPPPVMTAPAPVPAVNKSALENEIMDLLRELRRESASLRTREAQDDYRIHQQADELERLKSVQDEVESAFKKANRSSGSFNLDSESNIRYENVSVAGITVLNFTKAVEATSVKFNSDLGGKGSINFGLAGYVPLSNASAASNPVSFNLTSPKINWGMDGKLGHWDTTVGIELYTSDVMIGDFTRGNLAGTNRFEYPFEIKKYSEDKDTKNWQDSMTSLGYVPSTSSFTNQSNTGIVFDGVYGIGSNLPLVSKDAKAVILAGRMGRSVSETQKLEEGIKYSQPWANGFLQTSFSTLWVNEDQGIHAPTMPALDLKTYCADLAFDLKPVFLEIKGGYSTFNTGLVINDNGTITLNPKDLEAPAGQLALSLYPFTFYYNAISSDYAGIQSSVYLAGFNMNKYGYAYAANTTDSYYGFVGMVDDLISDRYGWRANLGWKGRQDSWMKSLPSFLDNIIVNLDVASNKEYRMIQDPLGQNVIEADNLITVYYPDDTGLWGSDIWGGYSGMHPLGQAVTTNVGAVRNDGFGTNENYFYVGNGYSSRVPLMLPVYDVNGQHVVYNAGNAPTTAFIGKYVFTQMDHLKTFNYITLTTKLQFNKMLSMAEPFYGSLFFTDHVVSGATGGTLAEMPDPNRPGQTLANIPSLFRQRVYDAAFFYQIAKDVNLMGDYGLETWNSDYTYPPVNWRTDSFGAGLAYDTPWGGGKFEFRYKHLINHDISVPANDFTADQIYAFFVMKF